MMCHKMRYRWNEEKQSRRIDLLEQAAMVMCRELGYSFWFLTYLESKI